MSVSIEFCGRSLFTVPLWYPKPVGFFFFFFSCKHQLALAIVVIGHFSDSPALNFQISIAPFFPYLLCQIPLINPCSHKMYNGFVFTTRTLIEAVQYLIAWMYHKMLNYTHIIIYLVGSHLFYLTL